MRVAGGAEQLLPGARRRAAGRRLRLAGSAVGVAFAVAGVMLAVALPGSLGRQAPVSPPNSEVARPGGPTQDAMWISSLGLEIAVPAGWEVNNYGCGMDSRPSVVRFRA